MNSRSHYKSDLQLSLLISSFQYVNVELLRLQLPESLSDSSVPRNGLRNSFFSSIFFPSLFHFKFEKEFWELKVKMDFFSALHVNLKLGAELNTFRLQLPVFKVFIFKKGNPYMMGAA